MIDLDEQLRALSHDLDDSVEIELSAEQIDSMISEK